MTDPAPPSWLKRIKTPYGGIVKHNGVWWQKDAIQDYGTVWKLYARSLEEFTIRQAIKHHEDCLYQLKQELKRVGL